MMWSTDGKENISRMGTAATMAVSVRMPVA